MIPQLLIMPYRENNIRLELSIASKNSGRGFTPAGILLLQPCTLWQFRQIHAFLPDCFFLSLKGINRFFPTAPIEVSFKNELQGSDGYRDLSFKIERNK